MSKLNNKEILYKPSRFNIYVKYNNEYLLCNLYYGSLAVIDEELYRAIVNNELGKIPENIMKELISSGFLVNKELDELAKLEVEFELYRNDLRYTKLHTVITPTLDCNLKCPYCYQDELKVPRNKYMNKKDVDTIFKFYKNVLKDNDKINIEISFYGGEPFLNWNVMKYFLDKLSKEDFSWVVSLIYTNATLLNDDILAYLNEIGKNQKIPILFQIPIDGSKPYHNKYRFFKDGKGTYDIVLNNIEKMKKYDYLRPLIRININKINYKSVYDLLIDLKQRGITDNVYFGILQSSKYPIIKPSNSEYLTGKELVNVLIELIKLKKKLGFNVSPESILKRKYVCCMFNTFSSLAFDPELYVYNCMGIVGLKEFSIGKITENGEFKIFPENYYKFYSRNPLKFEKCRNCKILPICLGGCAHAAKMEKGTFLAPSCGFHLLAYKEFIKLVYEFHGPIDLSDVPEPLKRK